MENLSWVNKVDKKDTIFAQDINSIANYCNALNKGKTDNDKAEEISSQVRSVADRVEVLEGKGSVEVASGNGDHSLVQNDIENNVAYAPYSTASGSNTVAGCHAFTFDLAKTNSSPRYNLNTVEGLAVGDVLSGRIVNNYDFYFTITAIGSNYIEVDKWVNETPRSDGGSFLFCHSKPTCGDAVIGKYSNAEGVDTKALGNYSHAEGDGTIAVGQRGHAEGRETEAAYCGHAEGNNTKAHGQSSHSEGGNTEAKGMRSHAEGELTIAQGMNSHAEGYQTRAKGNYSHSQGWKTEANGTYSHSEGRDVIVDGDCGHGEGRGGHAKGQVSHSEGWYNNANGDYSHSEGSSNTSNGTSSHTEGTSNIAEGENSHAEGFQTRAMSACQHTQGRWSIPDTAGKYAHIVGNGTYEDTRSNAHTLDWNGNAWFAGDVKAGDISLKALKQQVGDIDTALDSIIAIQNKLMGA